MFRGTACEGTDADAGDADAGPGGFLAAEFGAVPNPFRRLVLLRARRPTSWPSTVSICGTSIPQMKRKGWQSALVIAHFHRRRRCRRRRCRSEPIRVGGGERTEQKNSAVADTKLPSQYGKLFQLNRGIQIEFRESPPISLRHKDDWLKTRILGENDSF